MNNLTTNETKAIVMRTPDLIAAEINNIKDQTKRMVLYNSIEIGRRLVEAKSLVSHGEWGDWLEKSVDYSKSTANNLMRIFEEYGSDQITLLTDNAKNEAYGKLSYSQAVALLGMPDEEREAFITDNDIENMSTRELQQAIKEKEHALLEKQQLEDEKNHLQEERDELLKKWKDEQQESLSKIKELEDKISAGALSDIEKAAFEVQLKNERDRAAIKDKELAEKEKALKDIQKQKTQTDADIAKSNKEIETLKKKIKEFESKSLEVKKGATPEEIEKIQSEAATKYEKELAVLRVEKDQAEKRLKELELKANRESNAAVMKYSVYFETIVQNFGELLTALSEINETEPELHNKYKNSVLGLINKMHERVL